MRALVRTNDKSPSTLTLDPSHPPPTHASTPTSYLIHPHTCALTREELLWPEPKEPDFPVPGLDLAGVVAAVPLTEEQKAKAKFKVGDEIYALTTSTWKGNARDVSVAVEGEMARKPRGLSWEEAASVPLSALSAWQGLFVHAALEAPNAPQAAKGEGETREEKSNAGKRILVTAASGGVGLWAVQLASVAGAEVVGTCGKGNVEFVRGLGADEVLDYGKTGLREWVGEDRERRGFDVVFDCVGKTTLTDAWRCAREGGIVVSVAEPPDPKKPEDGVADGVRGVWFIVEPNGAQLAEVTELLEQGKCRAFVDSVYELEQFEEAFEKLDKGHARGKIVLKVRS